MVSRVSHLHGVIPPFDVKSKVIYFHDWRYVFQGEVGWIDEDGNRLPLMSFADHKPSFFKPRDIPWGIEIVPVEAKKTEPILSPEQTFEPFLGVFGGTLLKDGGKYRFWYFGRTKDSVQKDLIDGMTTGDWMTSQDAPIDERSYTRYAESDDGMNWEFPKLGLYEDDNGSYDNNITFDRGWGKIYGPGSVFIDPSAKSDQRYKTIYMDVISEDVLESYIDKRSQGSGPDLNVSEWAIAQGGAFAMCGAVSPDGISWTKLSDPLLIQMTDTTLVCEYDPYRKTYVAYIRDWFFNRRTVGRTETHDFNTFPQVEEILWPDPRMKPYEIWYSNAKTRMPDADEYNLMFPVCWDLYRDRFTVRMASSPDNFTWNLLPQKPVLEPGDHGDWDSGVVFSNQNLVELPDDKVGILYSGTPFPHKYPRNPSFGAVAWAYWEKGRLVALRSEESGFFSTELLLVKGSNLSINCKTLLTGYIKIEVVDLKGQPVKGRTFDDCDPIIGDYLNKSVTWNGNSDIGLSINQSVRFRFKMLSTDLYDIRFF